MATSLTEIRSIARSHGPSMVHVLRGIALEPTAPAPARVAAANSLLDRGFGKPEQTVIGEGTIRYVVELPKVIADTDQWLAANSPKVIEHSASESMPNPLIDNEPTS